MNQNLTHWRSTLTHWRSLLEYNCTTQHISKVLNLSVLFDPTIPLLRINLGKIDMAVWNLINKHTHIHSYIVMLILKAKDGNILMIIWWEIHWVIYSYLFHSIQWLKITSQKTSLVVQWLTLCDSNVGDLSFIPGQRTRSHTPPLKDPAGRKEDSGSWVTQPRPAAVKETHNTDFKNYGRLANNYTQVTMDRLQITGIDWPSHGEYTNWPFWVCSGSFFILLSDL